MKLVSWHRLLKFEQLIFYFLLFSLPLQTRIFLYSPEKKFIEWNSAFFYFTDGIIIALFLLFILRRLIDNRIFKNYLLDFYEIFCKIIFRARNSKLEKHVFQASIAAFFIIAAFSLFQISDFNIAFYRFFKLLEFIFLFFYLKSNASLYQLKNIFGVLVFSGFFQALIGDWQFHTQESLGLKWLGESDLASNIDGVAKIDTSSGKLIRAYGTFPHPNILAAFLMLSIFSLYYFIINIDISNNNLQPKKTSLRKLSQAEKAWSFAKQKFFCRGSRRSSTAGVGEPPVPKKSLLWLKKFLPVFLLFFLTYVLFLTFSRSIILIFLLGSLIFFWQNRRKKTIKFLITAFFATIIFLNILLFPEIFSRAKLNLNDQSIDLRLKYAKAAIEMIKQNPIFGVGYGNFAAELKNNPNFLKGPSWIYQPVHNIYLLIAAETGLIGLMFFLIFLIRNIFSPIKEPVLKIIIVSFLLIGLMDHFFLTTQQGLLMFWISLGIVLPDWQNALKRYFKEVSKSL